MEGQVILADRSLTEYGHRKEMEKKEIKVFEEKRSGDCRRGKEGQKRRWGG